jgi:hypothetical protein
MEQMGETGLPMRGAARPLTGTMPMGQGMAPGMMTMMGEMGQMMSRMQAMMGGSMPMTTTAPLSETTGTARP